MRRWLSRLGLVAFCVVALAAYSVIINALGPQALRNIAQMGGACS